MAVAEFRPEGQQDESRMATANGGIPDDGSEPPAAGGQQGSPGGVAGGEAFPSGWTGEKHVMDDCQEELLGAELVLSEGFFEFRTLECDGGHALHACIESSILHCRY